MINIETEENPWAGISCTSWLWPHAAFEDAQFEARRAVGNLTHGLRSTIDNQIDPNPTVNDLLRFVAAANAIHKAAEEVLDGIVTEAHTRGASWEDIGKELSIGRSAAHKRFAKKGQSSHLASPTLAKDMASLLIHGWIGNEEIPAALGYDDEEWEATPPAVLAQHAWRYIGQAQLVLDDALLKAETFEFLDGIGRCTRIIGKSFRAFITPQVFKAFEEACKRASTPVRTDHAPMTYFVRGFYLAALASALFSKGIEGLGAHMPEATKALAVRNFAAGKICLDRAVMATVRPECLAAMYLIEQDVIADGDIPYIVPASAEPDGLPPEMSMNQVFEAYWANNFGDLQRNLGKHDLEHGQPLSMRDALKLFDVLGDGSTQ